jgi:hypothetical protein
MPTGRDPTGAESRGHLVHLDEGHVRDASRERAQEMSLQGCIKPQADRNSLDRAVGESERGSADSIQRRRRRATPLGD